MPLTSFSSVSLCLRGGLSVLVLVTPALAQDASPPGLPYSPTPDPEGHYFLDLLPPGDYSARAESQGMSPEITPNLHVDVGGLLQLDFALSVAGAKETVPV